MVWFFFGSGLDGGRSIDEMMVNGLKPKIHRRLPLRSVSGHVGSLCSSLWRNMQIPNVSFQHMHMFFNAGLQQLPQRRSIGEIRTIFVNTSQIQIEIIFCHIEFKQKYAIGSCVVRHPCVRAWERRRRGYYEPSVTLQIAFPWVLHVFVLVSLVGLSINLNHAGDPLMRQRERGVCVCPDKGLHQHWSAPRVLGHPWGGGKGGELEIGRHRHWRATKGGRGTLGTGVVPCIVAIASRLHS